MRATDAAEVIRLHETEIRDAVVDLRRDAFGEGHDAIRSRCPGLVIAFVLAAENPHPGARGCLVALPEDARLWPGILAAESALRRAEGNILLLEARLAESDKLAIMGRLLAGVLHELNNPVDAVRRWVRQARTRSGEGSPLRADLDAALLGLDRMIEVLRSALGFARDTAVREPARTLAAVVEECRMEAEDLRGGARVVLDLEDPAETVPSPLGGALLNLLRNACAASGGSGTIVIRSRRRAGMLEIEVEDSGRGFEPADADLIFEPFHTTRRGGTGLGLPLARRLVERDGGRLTAASDGPGTGARFTISYPRPSRNEAPAGDSA